MWDRALWHVKGRIERWSNEGIGLKAMEKGDGEWMMETCISSHGERDEMERSTWCFPVKLWEIFIQFSITV